LPLISGDPSSTLRQLLRQASSRGVEIRAMLWANAKGPGSIATAFTVPQVEFINTLPTGRAILDAKTVLLTTLQVPNALGWGSDSHPGPPW
jgi:hypothetical protein